MAEEQYKNIRVADVGKLVQFEQDSKDAVEKFKEIKKRFNDINNALLSKWKGAGAVSYKNETDHILEKIGSLSDVLEAINEGVLKDTKEAYLKMDEELGKFNANPSQGEKNE